MFLRSASLAVERARRDDGGHDGMAGDTHEATLCAGGAALVPEQEDVVPVSPRQKGEEQHTYHGVVGRVRLFIEATLEQVPSC